MSQRIIDDATINSLATSSSFINEFPFLLATIPNPHPPCCGGQSPRLLDYNGIKGALAGMPTERQELFKRMLGVESCRVIYRIYEQVADHTF
jgi:hypothetical protein